MAVAVAQGARGAARGQSSAPRRATPPRRRPPTPRGPGCPPSCSIPAGAVAARQARSRRVAAGARLLEVDGSFDDALDGGARARRATTGSCSSTRSTRPDRGPEDGRVRDRRGARRGAGRARAPLRRRRQHLRVRRASARAAAAAPGRGQAAERATTVACAIRIASPRTRRGRGGDRAQRRRRSSTVSDAEISSRVARCSRESEGIFCEPSSAAGLARCAGARARATVVCVLTGHGLKDPVPSPASQTVRSIPISTRSATRPMSALTTSSAPGDDRQPRPRLRLRRRGARPLERARASAGATAARPTASTSACRAFGGSSPRRTGCRFEFIDRHPAGAWPRLERRDDRARARRGGDRRRDRSSTLDELLALGVDRSRATPTTSPPALAGGVCLTWDGADRPDRRHDCR